MPDETKRKGPGRPKGCLDKVKRKPGAGCPPIVITEEHLVQIYELAKAGKSRKIIASRIGVTNTTLDNWMRLHPHVRASWEAGQAEHEDSLQSVLSEVIADPKHKMRVPSVMFMLKCKHKWAERSQVEVREQPARASTQFSSVEITPADEPDSQ